ncbi:putative tail fiber [Staphylococcus phage Madawaska]|nr:putative tail fiber [Staphylococcus phage Madawaska]
MISILDKERKRIEGKLVAETFENVISGEKLVYDFSKKTEIINIEFKSKNYISENTHIIIKDESKNDSEFVCIEEDGLKSSLIPAYVKDLNNVFMNSNEELKGQLKSILSTLLLNTGYNIEYNDLVVDEEITLSKNNKSVFEKLLDILFEKDLSIRHKYDINTNERTLIINKGKDLRKSNPKEVSGRIPGFEFNVDKSNIKTGLIMYNDNNESITVKDSLNQARFIKDENYIFDTMEVKGKTRDEMEEIASKYLNDSSLNAIDLKMTGLVLRNWTNCHYNKFISSQIFINYKNIKPELTAGFQIYKLERSLFDYNIEKFNFFAKHKDSNELYKPEMLDNYTKYANDNIFIKDNTASKSNDVKLVESLVNKQLESFKNYINDISNSNNSSTDGSSVLQSNKELNFDAIISDFNLIKSQKDQVVNQLKSIFDSAYLKEDAIKIQVRDKIKEINNDFDKIKSEVNKLNRADQNESLMKDINKSFVGFYSVINSTKSIIELSNEAINLEMNKLQNEYSHGIKDTVFKEIARILGLTYDSDSQILKGDINVMSDINNLKSSLDLMKNKVERIESNNTESSMNLKGQLHDLVENLSNVLGLPINPDGYIDGNISNEDVIEQIKKQIEDTKQEISKSKENLALTKKELEKQQEELDQKSKDIDKAMAEANNVREDLGQELEVSQQEFNYYMDSRGDNLIFNGNADQGDESNFSGMYYDNSDAFQSAASFRMDGFNSTVSSERLIPINPEKTYKLSMFMKNNNSLPSSIGHLSYDKDGQLIESQHVMGSEKPVIELAQELRQGDKVIYFNSLDGLDDTYRFQSAPLDEGDDTPVYDYDRDGSIILPNDADDILSIDDPNALPDEEEDTVIYADDTPEEDATTSDEIDVPMPDSDVAVDTNSTPVDEEEAIKTMTNNYNVSNAGIVNRNINPNLTDYNDNHSLVIWNFKSNDGYNYGESAYSRNVFMNGWDFGAIDRENNCIYLNRPFDLINYDSEDGGFPAGTKVSGTFTDSNVEWSLIKDEDIPNTEEDDDPEEFNGWYHRQCLITKENVRGTNGFLYGAFYMTLYFKVNQSEDSDVIEFEDGSDEPKFWVTNLEMYDVTGLESVKKTVIDTNELVATMMTKKEMDDYRKQVTEGFSEVSQTVDMIRQEVSKKITDLDDKVMTDITSRIETIAGQIDLVSQSQKTDREELESQIGQIKIETDKITSLVQRITATEDNYSDLSTKVEQLDSSYTITAEKVEKQGTDITDLSGKLTVANDAITQEVTDRQSAVNDVMESSKALVKVEADRITNLVSKQEATDDTVSNLETSITAEIGRIDQRVTSETSVEALSDKIKIGGNNLLVGTEKFDLPFNKTNFSKYGGIIKDGIGYSLDYISESNRLAWSIFQEVDVIPNTDYVLSYNAHNKEGITQGIAYTPIMRLTDDGKIFDPLDYIITSGTYRETTEEDKRYNVRFNTGKSKKIRIYFTAKDVNSLAYISKPQLELGNIDTDWGLSKGDLEDRFSKAETRITQTEKDITLNATKLTETGKLIENNYSELKVETDKISGIVSEQKILDGKISANTSSIEQLPNQITSQVSAVENRVNENINNIQIGARNLLENSLSWNKGFEDNSNGSYQYLWRIYIDELLNKVEVGDEISISFDLQMERGDVFRIYDSVVDPGMSIGSDTITNIGNKEFRYKYTSKITKTSGTNSRWAIYAYNNNNGDKFSIKNIKIEKGNKSTDWTPAPEDVNSQINNIQVGGKNILRGTKDFDKSFWIGNFTDKFNKDGRTFAPLQNSGNQNWLTQTFKTDPYTDYIISFDAYKDGSEKGDIYPQIRKLKDDATDFDPFVSIFGYNEFNKSLTNNIVRYSVPFKSQESNYMRFYITRESTSKANIYISNIKIEKGNKATDWSPAPEDIETSISTVSSKIDQKADSIELSVNKISTYLNADNSLINTDLRNGWEGWVNADDNESLKINYAEKIDSPYWIYTFSGSSEEYPTDTTTANKDYLTIRSNANEGWKQWQTSSKDYSDGAGSPKLSKINPGTYTFSFQARKSRTTPTGSITVSLRVNKPGETLNPLSYNLSADSDLTEEWNFFKTTFTVTSADLSKMDRLRLIIASVSPYSNGEFSFKNIRLDKSDRPLYPRFSIADESDMTISTDDNIALAPRYRKNNISTSGNYRRMTISLSSPLKKNTKYKLAFDYNILSGQNTLKVVTLFPYRYPYTGSSFDDGSFLPVMPSTHTQEFPVTDGERNYIEFTSPNEEGVNQLLLYATRSGTDENSSIDASFENIKLVEYVDGNEDMEFDDSSVKSVFKYTQNDFGSTWPSILSGYLPVGREGNFEIGDYITGSVYIYIPSSAKKYLSYKIYFEMAGYENTSQSTNASISRVEIPASEFVFDTWKRYSFTTKIPRTTDNGETNYVRFLLRYNNYDHNKTFFDETRFYYGLPKLEKGNTLKTWTPSSLDKYSTGAMSSKISMNPESIKMISNNIDFNTDRMTIYNSKGNVVFSGDKLKISKTAMDTDNYVEINSSGLTIRKDGVDQMVDGLFLSETNFVATMPGVKTWNWVSGSAHANDERNFRPIILEDTRAGTYNIFRDVYKYGYDNAQLDEASGKDKATLNVFSYHHNRRYLKFVYKAVSKEGNNLYVTFSDGLGWKTNSNIKMHREIGISGSSKPDTSIKVATIDLGPPDNYNKTLLIQLSITGSTGASQMAQISIVRMSLSDFADEGRAIKMIT